MRKVLCMLLCVLMALACASAMAEDVILVGGIAPLTGAVSVYGQLVKDGVNLYISELNENGGLLGKKVEIVWEDDTGDAVEATNCYNRLVSKGADVIVGAVTTSPTLAVAALAYADNMPMITASATAFAVTGELGENKDQPYGNVFRACFLDPYQASLMAKYVKEYLNAEKVAVLYDNTNDYSIGLYENFVARAEELGMKVVAVESNVEGDADYETPLIKIADAEPDVLYVTYYYETAAKVLRQGEDVGLECWVAGADGFADIENQIKDAPALLDKVVFSDSFTSEDESELVQGFIKSFNASYGRMPVGFNALGYDSAKIILTAVADAGGTDKAAVCAAMAQTDLDCVTGHITFDAHNDPIKSVYFKTFENGQPKLTARIDP